MVAVSFLMTNESTDWSLTSSEILAVIYAVSYRNLNHSPISGTLISNCL